MKEFIIDDKYKFVERISEGNIWDVYKNENIIENPKSLYKFHSLDIFSLDSLFRGYFYLANPSSFNDPFDCNVNLVTPIKGVENLTTVQHNNYSSSGVCCLSETIDNHLLWAHYTNNYNGFALQFDEMEIETNLEEYRAFGLRPVIYPNKPKKVDVKKPYAHQYLFTTKLSHWEYEKEWRIITDLRNDNREMKYCNSNVKGIYIGHKVIDSKLGLYKMLLEIQESKYPNASVYIVYPHPTDLKLEFEKVI
ncbi:hypothetical protein BST92_11620 [Nonlabens arenilitoris]|uniref:DUF2971 domain-containing protein n=1 Tax=Nonlabens arenilitoris TaxID=1217969 RepID=A0A2S7UDM7_9FLAO|nr:DUF2971 domain-containing protein [Nonlabens arenilitoris]PQJ32534.1 hypothetical protein BST92_11620 [Nonlabens arenilitoris]